MDRETEVLGRVSNVDSTIDLRENPTRSTEQDRISEHH